MIRAYSHTKVSFRKIVQSFSQIRQHFLSLASEHFQDATFWYLLHKLRVSKTKWKDHDCEDFINTAKIKTGTFAVVLKQGCF